MPDPAAFIPALLVGLLKWAARQRWGESADATLAQWLAEVAGDTLEAKLRRLVQDERHRAALARAFEQADACFARREPRYAQMMHAKPLRRLERLEALAATFLQRPGDGEALLAGLEAQFRADWGKAFDAAFYRQAARDYRACLEDALAGEGGLLAVLYAKVARIEQLIETFVASVRRLPIDYAPRIENFLQAYLGTPDKPVPFGGRDTALKQLDAWLTDPETPYLLLTAPAGRGKSALLVRWLERVRQKHPDLAVAFVPVSIRYSTNLASVTFAALAAQLARIFGEEVPTDPNTPAEMWKEIAAQYLRREPPPGGLLVVLDGLDEAADWTPDAGLFPAQPKPGLKVVVSARLTAERPQAADWQRALGWEGLSVQALDLAPLDLAGLRDVLAKMGEKMGVPLDELARRPEIVTELHRLTEGDPLLVRFYVEDLWGRGEAALRLTPDDLRGMQPGYKGYFQRWWEDQRQLWGDKAPLRERSVREVLNLLAAALGPLTQDDLFHLADPNAGLEDVWVLEEALRPLARFVVHTPEGYIFGHPKLGDFFFAQLTPEEQEELEARFLRWGDEVFKALEEGRLAPQDAPPYIIRYYQAHLKRAGAWEALRRLEKSKAWARAQLLIQRKQQELKLSIIPQAFSDQPSEEDYLGYQLYAEVLADFIKHDQTGKPLTLAITAPWGMGKTTLMRMIQRRLKVPRLKPSKPWWRRRATFIYSLQRTRWFGAILTSFSQYTLAAHFYPPSFSVHVRFPTSSTKTRNFPHSLV